MLIISLSILENYVFSCCISSIISKLWTIDCSWYFLIIISEYTGISVMACIPDIRELCAFAFNLISLTKSSFHPFSLWCVLLKIQVLLLHTLNLRKSLAFQVAVV